MNAEELDQLVSTVAPVVGWIVFGLLFLGMALLALLGDPNGKDSSSVHCDPRTSEADPGSPFYRGY